MIKAHKRKVRTDRILISIGICVLAIALIGGGYFGIKKLFFKNPYTQYETYDKNSKKIGDMKHYTEDKENSYYISFYYPQFKDKTLDGLVEKYKKELPKDFKNDGKFIISVDYDVHQVFKHYTALTFKQKIYNEKDGKLMKSSDITYNYDSVGKKLMKSDDILRRNYLEMMQIKAKENGIDEKLIKTNNLDTFSINEKDVTFFVAGDPKNKITVNYEENKQYIKLHDKNIPSFYQDEPVQPAKEPEVDPNKPMIAITFDDGPHGQYTQEIMKEFEKYNGRATFFMLGQNVVQYPNVVKDMHKRGFELGNHSWDHSTAIAKTMNHQQVSDELYNTQDAIYKLTGVEPKYFRPPYGAVNKTVLNANYLGYAFWDIDTLDWQSKNVDSIFNAVVSGAKKKNIVALIHDIHEPSMQSVKKILPYLNEQGYQFVTYATLMKYESKYLTSLDNVYGIPKEYANGR